MNKRVFFVVLIAFGVVLAVIALVTVFVLFVFLPSPEELLLSTCNNPTLCQSDVQRSRIQPTCDSLVYCQGDLLHYAQTLALSDSDSKYFVDLMMLEDEEVILEHFNALMKRTDKDLNIKDMKDFLNKYFVSNSGLNNWKPSDFDENPRFLEDIDSTEVRNFSKSVVALWKDLGRKVDENVRKNPQRYSLIYVPHGFIIPGGRFREYFYWDSYWIIDGLLISNMTETAKGMLENFMWLIDRIGFIPNSGRVYHIRRSQPPLFSLMVKRYYEHTGDKKWLAENIHRVAKEAEFWVANRTVSVKANKKQYRVAIYNATTSGPRPEAYKEDLTAASIRQNEAERQRLFIELKSAAESGWDFSARWIFDANGDIKGTVASTNVTRVAPVDLNAFLYGVYDTLAFFYRELGDGKSESHWRKRATDIKQAIADLMWNDEDHIWYDYDMVLKTQRKHFFASNLTPLWTKAYDTADAKDTAILINWIIEYLKNKDIMKYTGGIPTSTEHSGEQWDLPNAWPCLQAIIVEGLLHSGDQQGKEVARKLAVQWIESIMSAFEENGHLYEKYDALTPGKYGGGGEYTTQVGFGWTNGVALRFIKDFYSIQKDQRDPDEKE